MTGSPDVLKQVPLFSLFDDEEMAVLAAQVEIRTFKERQRIYKIGDASGQGYVVISGSVEVSTLDEDGQEVVVDRPGAGDFFGFASMLGQTPHQTHALSIEESTCIEIDRNDILALLTRKPHAGMDLPASVAGVSGSIGESHASARAGRVHANSRTSSVSAAVRPFPSNRHPWRVIRVRSLWS